MSTCVILSGMLAEFDDAEHLIAAVRRTREAGFTRLEAYTPFPVEGLPEELGFRSTRLPLLVLIGGIVGGLGGYAMQYWVSVTEYPLNIGGRPLNSWPSFIPVTFEMTVLVAALTAVLGMLALNGLPRPNDPLFAVPGFERATQDRFFLYIAAADPKFEADATRKFLQGLSPLEVLDVPQ